MGILFENRSKKVGLFERSMKKIGKFKPEIEFTMFGPYQVGAKCRGLIQHDNDIHRISVPESTSLWIQIGETLGIKEKKLRLILDQVPYADNLSTKVI